ncbi:MAG TPA: glycoside hydrolase family 2 TIM barrel-domain containing protein, partial [Vicinamibacteria bacterium]|nr:glycoside hydrolase family 2 TIM barrel-domain containing protein [Vicinamibacteria bacterium]
SAPKPALTDSGNGDLVLTGGWKLQEARKVAGTARELSVAGFDASSWFDATVPGTVLTTLVDQGVYPEPTYGLNNMAIPESLNREDYWYRTEFTPSRDLAGRTLTLTLNGVNYAADVWLNGARLGEIRGAFLRGVFDVSSRLRAGEPNALVVRISPVPHPGVPHEESLKAGAGPNGGAMLFDGPTFFCTEGWDWIPGIRDRVAGIWQDVVLHVGGPVRIGDVQVVTDLPLPDTTTADVTVKAALENRSAEPQRAVVRGEFEGVSFEKAVSLAPGERTVVVFSPADSAQLRVRNPRLWWPNGYGKPELYHLKLSALDSGGHASDLKAERFGIREVTYELSALDAAREVRRFELSPTAAPGQWVIDKRHAALRETPLAWVPTFAEGGESSSAVRFLDDTTTAPFLVIKVNGKRVVCKGGNWGLDDAMKRVSRERLEPYFRMERDANLTMIRNWCGQNTEKVFFDLADEYGLMVWNDFWTSTQNWNLQPGDLDLWLANAADTIKRFRNHPSIVIWCGRNEGVPPPFLNEGVDALVREHDGTRYYQPNSNKLSLNDSGPWVWADPVNFFTRYGKGFTTELGLPSAPTADAVRAMMPEADWWPISDAWAYHDWHQADHGEVPVFMTALATQFGEAVSLDDFSRKAQMLNYVGHRAMFEGLNANLWKPASGRLMWMSHPAWPSMEWQLYTSDYDAHASYFGAKKACEPVHVQLNLHDRQVVVSNTTLEAIPGARVSAEIHDLSGRRLALQSAVLVAGANATTPAFTLDEAPATGRSLYFVRLRLASREGRALSDNFYWQARREEDHKALNDLPKVALTGTARVTSVAGVSRVEIQLRNPSKSMVLMVKPTLRSSEGQRVLPAFATDGYFSLVPGESRTVQIEAPNATGPLQVSLEGWNAERVVLPV